MILLNVIANPGTFFEDRRNDLSLVPVLAIVLIVGAISTVATYLTSAGVFTAFAGGSRSIPVLIYVAAIGQGLVVTVIGWAIFAALFHLLSTIVYEGEGTFNETLAVTGWGYVPKVLGSLIALGVAYYVFFVQGINPPANLDPSQVSKFTASIRKRPLFQWQSVATILITLWSAFIWVSGISETHDIEERQAAVVVAVPVVITVAWTLFNLL